MDDRQRSSPNQRPPLPENARKTFVPDQKDTKTGPAIRPDGLPKRPEVPNKIKASSVGQRPKPPSPERISEIAEEKPVLPQQGQTKQRLDALKEKRQQLKVDYKKDFSAGLKGKIKLFLYYFIKYSAKAYEKFWQVWTDLWFKFGWRMRTILVVATFFVGALFFGWFIQGGKKVVGVKDNSAQGTDVVIKWQAPEDVAEQLQYTFQQSQASTVTVKTKNQTAIWYGTNKEFLASDEDNKTFFNKDGSVQTLNDQCWSKSEDKRKFSMKDVLLYLEPKGLVWKENEDGVVFEANNFGVLGKGEGRVNFEDGLVSKVRYIENDGSLTQFDISYGNNSPPQRTAC